ncbi:MAG: A/G-specific adenine glycosylase [Bacteroidota bacterium]|uniref:Adenine DNA glycosylase n=1 Tax=Flagellimonas profundi TaxID=2915620 RepID=A0ABS3FGG9_9FLAO|nr:A/G-specific adenine glycosylase [Allomuricauda profundi]MBO0341815.1 A/G-specific adenine glycosylase [Allomuricauda profundi]MEC7770546.1 A/G-specific adenine glycosylase [Bacteroidota bacterium]
MNFAPKILNWYREHQRNLPWRETRDPYKVWLSEIILQQTRVAQGMPYYLRFVEAFPTVYDLADAPEEQVLKLWQGLGYYSRARNLHTTAKMVVEDFNGEFPNTYKELKSLKGVGDYTASAIASFCFDIPEPVVDGNVYRVLSRYFGVDTPINSTQGIKYFKELAREVMDPANIRDYNQGVMEFGAVQCAPKKPYCLLCPLQESCVALQENKVDRLPVKLNKTKVRNRYFNYIVLLDDDRNTVLEQRTGKGIWRNLYQFPLIESEKQLQAEELRPLIKKKDVVPETASLSLYNNEPIVHKLSHQHLHTQFWILKTSDILEKGTPWKEIGGFPVPVLIADFIRTLKI